MARDLGISAERVEAALTEISSRGMARADHEAGLMWLPRAFGYNRPRSPNVIRSWREQWAELPECDLLVEAHEHLRAMCHRMGPAFGRAFDQSCPWPPKIIPHLVDVEGAEHPESDGNGGGESPGQSASDPEPEVGHFSSPKGFSNSEIPLAIQEQEQEQEQEQDQDTPPNARARDLCTPPPVAGPGTALVCGGPAPVYVDMPDTAPRKATAADIARVLDHYRAYHPHWMRTPAAHSREARLVAARLREGFSVVELCSAIDGNHRSPFHSGQNKDGKQFHDLGLILRSADYVTRFLEVALGTGTNAVARGQISVDTERSLAGIDGWLRIHSS
jgi:hypothetical protein